MGSFLQSSTVIIIMVPRYCVASMMFEFVKFKGEDKDYFISFSRVVTAREKIRYPFVTECVAWFVLVCCESPCLCDTLGAEKL